MSFLALLAALAAPPPPPAAIPPPPPMPVIVYVTPSGEKEVVHLAFLNIMDLTMSAGDPLYARLIVNGRATSITLHRLSDVQKVPASGFVQLDYCFALPSGADGNAVLSFGDPDQGYFFKIVRDKSGKRSQ